MREEYVSKSKKIRLQFAVVAVIALLWELLPRVFDISALVLPPLSQAVLRLTQPLTGEGTLWQNTVVTLLEMGAAFAIASLLGVSVGVLIGGNPRLTNFFTPVLLAAFAVPIMVLIPLFLAAFGLGVSSKIAFASLYAFFPVVFNTVVGVSQVDRLHLAVGEIYGLSSWEVLRKIVLRSAARDIMNGLQNAVAICMVAVISIEMFGATQGLGYLINRAGQRMRIDETYGLILLVLVLAVALLGAIKAAGRAMNVRMEMAIE